MIESNSLNEKEYKKILVNFSKIASRFLQTNFQEANDNLDRFLQYIEDSPVIYEFIEENNIKKYDIEQLLNPQNYNKKFKLPIRTSEEVAFTYQLLRGISESERTYLDIAMGYNDGNRLQVAVSKFNQQVAKPLVDHIVSYLEEVAIDMDLDKKTGTQFNIHELRGQINHSEGQSSITANQIYSESKVEDLKKLSENFIKELSEDDKILKAYKEEATEFIEVAIQEIETEKPKKAILKMALEKVNEIKGIADAGSSLYQSGSKLVEMLGTFI